VDTVYIHYQTPVVVDLLSVVKVRGNAVPGPLIIAGKRSQDTQSR